LLPHTDLGKALSVAEKIRQSVSEAPIEGMGEKRLTISIGVAGFPDIKASNVEELVRKADEALYCAKEGGRNKVVKAE